MSDEVNTARLVVQVDRDLAGIVPTYLENRRKDVVLITDMLERGEFDAARVLGHRMKGSGAGYGFADISSIGARMEQAARETSQAELAACVAELTAYLDRLDIVYA
ncbi:MAG: Hpt domain-containing protein [Magnetococcus sp. DMHC-8]